MALRWARSMLCYWNFLQSDVGHACFEDPEQASWAGQDPENVTVLCEPLHLRRETSLKQSWPSLGEEGIFMCLEFIKIGNAKKGAVMSMNYYKSWEALVRPVFTEFMYSWILGESRQARTFKTERPKSKWDTIESPCSHIFYRINTHDKQTK